MHSRGTLSSNYVCVGFSISALPWPRLPVEYIRRSPSGELTLFGNPLDPAMMRNFGPVPSSSGSSQPERENSRMMLYRPWLIEPRQRQPSPSASPAGSRRESTSTAASLPDIISSHRPQQLASLPTDQETEPAERDPDDSNSSNHQLETLVSISCYINNFNSHQ